MSETCWFCKKRPGDAMNSIGIPIIKILNVEETRGPGGSKHFVTNNIKVTTTYRYLEEKITVPRCSTCAKMHSNMRIINVLWIVVPILVIILGFLAFVVSPNAQIQEITGPICGGSGILGFVLFFGGLIAKSNYMTKQGVLYESDKKIYPPLLERQKNGWVPNKKL